MVAGVIIRVEVIYVDVAVAVDDDGAVVMVMVVDNNDDDNNNMPSTKFMHNTYVCICHIY